MYVLQVKIKFGLKFFNHRLILNTPLSPSSNNSWIRARRHGKLRLNPRFKNFKLNWILTCTIYNFKLPSQHTHSHWLTIFLVVVTNVLMIIVPLLPVCVKPFQLTVMQATKRKRDIIEDSDKEGNFCYEKIGSLIVEGWNVISVQWIIRLKKKTNLKDTFFFGVVAGRGCVRTWKTLGRGKTFVWLTHARLGGGLLVTGFQHGLFLAELLAQHILIITLLLTHL